MATQDIKILKDRYNLTTKRLSELSGVPEGTLKKILSGETEKPRKSTRKALSKVFEEFSLRDQKNSSFETMLSFGLPDKVQGSYTVGDLESVPEGRYAELIDGVIYDMSPEKALHELVLTDLRKQFDDYFKTTEKEAFVFQSGICVYSSDDDKNLLIPDLAVLLDGSKLSSKGIVGGPDFVLEVMSSATSEKDQGIKVRKYGQLGVKEYWVVDTNLKLVTAFYYSNVLESSMCNFESKMPVAFLNNELSISFADIKSLVYLR